MLLEKLIAAVLPRRNPLREPELQIAVNGVRFWTLSAAEDEIEWLEQHGQPASVCLVRRTPEGSYPRVP